MEEFHHHPDDLIFIRHPEGDYCDSLENFLKDASAVGIPYRGKGDSEEIRYRSDRGRIAFKDGNQIFERERCEECETILANREALLQAKARREAEAQTASTRAIDQDPEYARRQRALQLLKDTDWMVLREMTTSIPVPPAIKDARKKAYELLPVDYHIDIPKVLKGEAQ